MPITIPPECQAKLDAAEAAAQEAADSLQRKTVAMANLQSAQAALDNANTDAIARHVVAVEAFEEFIKCLIPPPPAAGTAAKK